MTVMERPGSLEADELHTLLTALVALRKGDAGVRLPLHWQGVAGRVADAFNEVVEQNAAMALQVADRGVVLNVGSVVMSGAASEVADSVQQHYLGAPAQERRSLAKWPS